MLLVLSTVKHDTLEMGGTSQLAMKGLRNIRTVIIQHYMGR